MIPVHGYEGEKVAVLGLGRSGLATARALEAGGAIPLCWDDGAEARARAEAAGLTLHDLGRREAFEGVAAQFVRSVAHGGFVHRSAVAVRDDTQA